MRDPVNQINSVLFKGYVNEGPVPEDNFVVQSSTLHVADALVEGCVLVELLYLSV